VVVIIILMLVWLYNSPGRKGRERIGGMMDNSERLLAEKVMGFKIEEPINGIPWTPKTNIYQAFMVLDKFDGAIELFKTDNQQWGCNIYPEVGSNKFVFGGYFDIPVEAICAAAVKVVEEG